MKVIRIRFLLIFQSHSGISSSFDFYWVNLLQSTSNLYQTTLALSRKATIVAHRKTARNFLTCIGRSFMLPTPPLSLLVSLPQRHLLLDSTISTPQFNPYSNEKGASLRRQLLGISKSRTKVDDGS